MGNLLLIPAAPATLATPRIDMLVRVVIESLRQMCLRGRNLAVGWQALESFTLGFFAQEFVGYPHHLDNRQGQRRMVGLPDLNANAQTTDDIAAINEASLASAPHARSWSSAAGSTGGVSEPLWSSCAPQLDGLARSQWLSST